MNTVYFVSDRLEKYQSYLKKISRDFPFFTFSFDDIIKFKKAETKEPFRENDLIIIHKEFSEQALIKNRKKNLRAVVGIPLPHFLFISTNKEIERRSIDIVFDENDFFYLLSPDEEKSDVLSINYFYIRLLFKCIENRKRVHDYIVCSFQTIVESTVINNQKRKIEKLYRELQELSRIDSLTGVLNRKAFFEALENERKRVLTELRRLHTIEEAAGDALSKDKGFSRIITFYGHYTCLMIDIDNFKKVNDDYGHSMGDIVLQEFGKILKTQLYENDIIGRYGGEEFIALLPETSSINAVIPAERIREALKEIVFHCKNIIFSITVSIGISDFHTSDERYEDIINRADKALYNAKQNGKDRIKVYEEIFKN
jgi:diguanylate cyclase (GGDEF)-like protein